MVLVRASALVLAVLVAAPVMAQETPSWDDGCATIHDRLADAFAAAPEMALGNRTKVDRLLRDARVAEDASVCVVKLRRAHALIAQAYVDAGEPLDLMAEGAG